LLAGHLFKPLAVKPDTGAPDAVPASKAQKYNLPVKKLLLVLGAVATTYAAVLLIWGGNSRTSLAVLWSWTGAQAGGLCLLNYLLRGLRWRLWMAHFGRQLGWTEGMRFYLSGYAFTPTPGNIGEAVRGLMLTRQPLSTAQSLAIFGAERLADLLCLLLLSLPVVAWLLGHGPLREPIQASPGFFALAAGLCLMVLALAAGLAFRYRARVLQRFLWLRQAWSCLAVRPLLWFALTLTAWAAQGLAVWLLCGALQLELPVLTATGFYATAMVAGALSALPAGLGGMEAVLTGLLVAQNATAAQALTITVLTRLLTLWLAVAIGVAALLYSAAIRKDISFS
jgi:uncharacterized membrane protein YbhN (UPF0104 family)